METLLVGIVSPIKNYGGYEAEDSQHYFTLLRRPAEDFRVIVNTDSGQYVQSVHDRPE